MKLKEFKAELIPKSDQLKLFAQRKALNETLAGEWVSNIKRHGVEFAGYRQYTPNDDAKFIDWKASLRANKTLIKELEVERSQNILFLFDVSDSMLFTTTKKLKCEYAAEVIASISFAVGRTGDNVGLAMFTDKVIKKIQPQMGKNQYYKIVKILSNPENYGGNFDLENSIKQAASFLNRRCTIIIISDFVGIKDTWKRYFELLSQDFSLIGIMIRDPIDNEFPKGVGHVIMQDPFSGEKLYIDSNKFGERYMQNVNKEKHQLNDIFNKIGSPMIELCTDEDYFEKLIRFFKRAEKEWS
jgi:uncharacterized protein (DUF58 family)